MTKKELASRLAKRVGVSVAKANAILTAIFAVSPEQGLIAQELEGGNKVTIPGFGTFDTRKRASRTGTNPSSGKRITIPSRTYVFFRAGKTLRERIDK